MADSFGRRLGNALWRAVTETLSAQTRRRPSGRSRRRRRPASEPSRTHLPTSYPGDFTGVPFISYEPIADAHPDPGEVAWGWVPYEEDHQRGKDRPILMIGRDRGWLLGLGLTSKDHHRDADQEAAAGRHWIDIGSGDWDVRHRDSEVRIDRIIRVDPTAVRRTAGKLDRARFDAVAAAVRQHRRR